jgi:hypothetical protein
MVFFTDNYQDCSTSDGYRFEFYCKRCGNGYSSSFQHPVTGSGGRLIRMGGDVIGGNVGESARTLSRDAEWTYAGLRGSTRDRALAKAVHEMKSHFRRCDRCGQWVCGQMCWNAERGQCVSCAPRHSQEAAGILAVARSDRSCARCGTALGNAKFCGECGTRPADPMTSAHYRLIFPGGQPEESGHADVQVADGTLVLIPPGGEVLRVPVREIESSGPYGFSVLVTLAGGATIELSGLGEMRTALLTELRDARAQAAALLRLVALPERAERWPNSSAACRWRSGSGKSPR